MKTNNLTNLFCEALRAIPVLASAKTKHQGWDFHRAKNQKPGEP